MKKIEIVIPTRNRLELLKELLLELKYQTVPITQIWVIGSSDNSIAKEVKVISERIEYCHTTIKSAAIQRNIGLDQLSSDSDFVAFLDDDVRIPNDYLEVIISDFEKYKKAVGVSGVTNSEATVPKKKLQKIIKYIFLLESKNEGIVNRAGINIPVKRRDKGCIQSQWLLGCSVWDLKKVRHMRFETNLQGLSLGEDVIFSMKANKFGDLIVDTNVVFENKQSTIARPDEYTFWNMWSKNRKIILNQQPKGISKILAYHWANSGQALIIAVKKDIDSKAKIRSIRGLFKGSL